MTNYQRTANWLKACGKEPGNAMDISVQLGCHLEEFAEFLSTLRVDSDGHARMLTQAVDDLNWLSLKIKKREVICHIPEHKRLDALDALCDCEVTGNGVAYLAGFDKDAADQEVLRSNESKFDADGRPVILPGGKIGKSDRYTPPNLKGFV